MSTPPPELGGPVDVIGVAVASEFQIPMAWATVSAAVIVGALDAAGYVVVAKPRPCGELADTASGLACHLEAGHRELHEATNEFATVRWGPVGEGEFW